MEERRTGRTTAIMATALAELLNTGKCSFCDHRTVNKKVISHDTMRSLINAFKGRLNGFMGFDCTQHYKFEIKESHIEVAANEKHPLYKKYHPPIVKSTQRGRFVRQEDGAIGFLPDENGNWQVAITPIEGHD